MATSKTLTPTNVTIQIPEFTDQPDQRVNSNCIDKEADAINALNTQIANLITTESFTITISESIAAGATKSYGKDVTKNGYTPLGIIQQFGSGTGSFAFQDYYIEGNSLIVYVRNVSSSAATLNYIKVVVLYKKN